MYPDVWNTLHCLGRHAWICLTERCARWCTRPGLEPGMKILRENTKTFVKKSKYSCCCVDGPAHGHVPWRRHCGAVEQQEETLFKDDWHVECVSFCNCESAQTTNFYFLIVDPSLWCLMMTQRKLKSLLYTGQTKLHFALDETESLCPLSS